MASCPNRSNPSTPQVHLKNLPAIAPWFLLVLTTIPLFLLCLCCCCCLCCVRCSRIRRMCPGCCCLYFVLSLISALLRKTFQLSSTTDRIYHHTAKLLSLTPPAHHASIIACIARSQSLSHTAFVMEFNYRGYKQNLQLVPQQTPTDH